MRYFPVTVLIVFVCFLPLNAEKESTLAELLKYGEKNNPSLKALYKSWKSSVELSGVAAYWPDPTVSLGYFVRSIETRTGPQKLNIGVRQVIPWFGKMKLKKQKALYMTQLKWQKYQERRLKLRFQIVKALAEFTYLQEEHRLKSELLELLLKSEQSLESRFINHQVPYSGILLIRTQKDRVEESLMNLKDRLEVSRASVNSLLNRNKGESVPLLKLPVPINFESAERFFEKSRATNPGVLALNALVNAENTGIKIASKAYWPDPGIGINYIVNRKSSMDVPDNGKDPLAVSLSFRIPLNRKRLRAGVEAAKNSAESAVKRREDFVNRLRVDIESAVSDIRSSFRNTELYRDRIVPRAERLKTVTLKEWENGKGTIDGYLDACRIWLEFRLNYQKYLKKNRIGRARLMALSGEEDLI